MSTYSLDLRSQTLRLALACFLLSLPAGDGFAEPLVEATSAETTDWLNIQGIGWDGGPNVEPLLRVTHGLGYRYVYHGQKHDAYEGPYRRDLFFYYNDPHKHIQPSADVELDAAALGKAKKIAPFLMDRYPMLPRAIDEREFRKLKKRMPEVYRILKDKFEATKSWANTDQEFPDNLAQLQTWGDEEINRWEPSPDFQQDVVIDEHVAAIVKHVREQERPGDNYLFKGIVIDVPELWKEFNWNSSRGLPGTPDEARTTVTRPGVELDHATLQEGWYHFLARLQDALVAEFPERDIKMIYEPSNLWNDWGYHVANIEYESITPDMMDGIRGDAMVSEKPSLDFLTDENLRNAGWKLSHIGTVTGDLFPKNPSFTLQLVALGETASRGSNFFAYGTFAREFRKQLHEYAPDLLVIRPIAGWENEHRTPLDKRLWDYQQRVYLSPTAVADEKVIAGLRPKSDRIVGAVRHTDAKLKLGDEIEIESIRPVNAFFEAIDGPPPLVLADGVLVTAKDLELPVGFEIMIHRSQSDARVFSHPNVARLVHRPQDNPVLLRDLHNPGFEAGGEGWYTGDGGSTRVVPVSDRVHTGELAGKLIDRTRRWHAFQQRVPEVLNVKGPGTYRVTGWTQPARGMVNGRIVLKVGTPSGEREFKSKDTELKSGEWTQLEAEFDVAFDQPVAVGVLSFQIDHETMPFYLDTVRFEKVAD